MKLIKKGMNAYGMAQMDPRVCEDGYIDDGTCGPFSCMCDVNDPWEGCILRYW